MKPPYQDSTGLRQAVIDACLQMNAEGINQGSSGQHLGARGRPDADHPVRRGL